VIHQFNLPKSPDAALLGISQAAAKTVPPRLSNEALFLQRRTPYQSSHPVCLLGGLAKSTVYDENTNGITNGQPNREPYSDVVPLAAGN